MGKPMFEKQRYLLKIFWISLLWHKKNPYGYCDGWNWATCKSLNNQACPFIKHGVNCYNNILEGHERFHDLEMKQFKVSLTNTAASLETQAKELRRLADSLEKPKP